MPAILSCSSVLLLFSSGILLPNEKEVLEGLKTNFNTYFVPLIWASSIVARARKEGRIKDDFAVKTLIDVNKLVLLSCLTEY